MSLLWITITGILLLVAALVWNRISPGRTSDSGNAAPSPHATEYLPNASRNA